MRFSGRGEIAALPADDVSTHAATVAVAKIIAGPICDATGDEHVDMHDGRYRFCAQCGETLKPGPLISKREALTKARAVLDFLAKERT